jgi:beta-xylosidase
MRHIFAPSRASTGTARAYVNMPLHRPRVCEKSPKPLLAPSAPSGGTRGDGFLQIPAIHEACEQTCLDPRQGIDSVHRPATVATVGWTTTDPRARDGVPAGSRRFQWTRGAHRLPLLVALCVALAGKAAFAGVRPSRAAAPIYRNPVFARDYPDPSVVKVGADYYAYGTTTGWESFDHLFPILRSRDLAHWSYVADAMPSSPDWGVGDWWAPGVIAHNGTYYMFYSGQSTTLTNSDSSLHRHCVAVATATRPTGPFRHRAIIGCGQPETAGLIDPQPFVDADGKAYLYYKQDNPVHIISVVRLRPDLLHTAGAPKDLLHVSQLWEHGGAYTTIEGPFVVKHGRLYDLFYSGNDYAHDYGMGYATSSSPLGPFKKCGCNPILFDAKGVTGPGGGSVIQGPHGGWWLVYHAWSSGAGASDPLAVRNLRIDPLTWTGDRVSVRGPTTAGEPLP